MNTEQNRAIILQLYREAASLRPWRTRFNPGSNSFTRSSVSLRPSGLETFHQFFAKVNKAFPEYQLTINSILTKENQVSVCYSISGVQKGYFMGRTPHREKLTIIGVDLFRLENDQVIEYRNIVRELNALPPQYDKIQVPSSSNWSPENQAVITFNKKS